MFSALAIGAAVGLVLGLTGAGGSLFAVPLLMLGLGLGAGQATGLALGAVAVSALWGVITRLPRRDIVWLPAIVLAGAGAVFAPPGRWLAMQLPEPVLLGGFTLLVLWVAVRMWRQASTTPVDAGVTRATPLAPGAGVPEQPLCQLSASGQLELRPQCLLGIVLGGALTGFLSGVFGVGGGFVIVPLLVLLTGLSMAAAVATSLAVIATVSSSGFVSYLWLGDAIDWTLLAWLSAGGVLGMAAGSRLAQQVAGARLQQVFVVLMVALTATVVLVQWLR